MYENKGPYNSVVCRFDSVSEFLDHQRNLTAKYPKGSWGVRPEESYGSREWYDYQTRAQAIDNCLKGREDWAREAEKFLASIDADRLPTSKLVWDNGRAGAFPVVPDYLAGVPEHMRRRVETVDDYAPVTVICPITYSQSLSSENVKTRGSALLALVMALQDIRPVELYLEFEGSRGTRSNAIFGLIRVDTSPLDLAQCAYLLSSAAVLRHLGFAFMGEYGFEGKWAWESREAAAPEHMAKVRECLALAPQDVLLVNGHAKDPMIEFPIATVNATLARFRQHLETEG